MKKNGFALLVLILVIVILAVVGYFAYKSYYSRSLVLTTSPSPVSTQTNIPVSGSQIGWGVFTNSTYNYSIEIPSDWDGDWSSPINPSLVGFHPAFDGSSKIGEFGDEIFIKVIKINPSMTVFQYIDQIDTKGCNQKLKNQLQIQSVTIDGHSAAKYSGICQTTYGHVPGEQIFIKNNDEMIETWAANTSTTNNKVLNQAIKTFKFLK